MGDSSAEHTTPPRRSLAARAVLKALVFYQVALSPLKMGSTCRFEPTCSAYGLDAVREHGAVKGVALTLIRISKCGPWHPGGYDPVVPHQPHFDHGCATDH
ncbi:membrane protein insertion efficiency factor YidD [Corynebacterium aquilae]|uniref:membrane protein insertion efficiency factor YidD n=1 Tax=Corynebacterium aquilae TaxID=203263 RepID=UPI0009526CE5|nr:membrane protein insertion efficiency factor YidD [Corynebacterium aquilae]